MATFPYYTKCMAPNSIPALNGESVLKDEKYSALYTQLYKVRSWNRNFRRESTIATL